MRIVSALVVLAAVLVALAGCGANTVPRAGKTEPSQVQQSQVKQQSQVERPEGSYPLVLTDGAGRQVRVERRPERILSLAPSNTEILFALGAGPRVVGVDRFSDYPPEAREKAQVGGIVDPSFEKIVALEPDIVFAINGEDIVSRLEDLGLTVFVLEPRNLEQVYEGIRAIGRIIGSDGRAEEVVSAMQARVRTVTARVADLPPGERPKVFHEVWPEPLATAGPGTFIDDLITLAGGRNIFADAGEEWPQVSAEVVVQRDPDVIITSFPESVSELKGKERGGWEGVAAVKNGRIGLVDQDLIARPGPRIVAGLEAVARVIHPELFP